MTYGGFKRMTGFCKTYVPQDVLDTLESVKDNDEAVKKFGIDLGVKMCKYAAISRSLPPCPKCVLAAPTMLPDRAMLLGNTMHNTLQRLHVLALAQALAHASSPSICRGLPLLQSWLQYCEVICTPGCCTFTPWLLPALLHKLIPPHAVSHSNCTDAASGSQ